MNLLTTRHYLKQAKAIIVRELISSDQLATESHIDDALVLRTDQLEQIAQRILDQLMAEPPVGEKPADINAWSVQDE